MNKAIRIQKSEAARNKRHQRREVANKKLLNEYARLRKLKKSK
jgi:hypothetical protein|tara:strand:+ start:1347 stop:1475 length:129 start_codon:yes stop_codon:yes gene_type:complete